MDTGPDHRRQPIGILLVDGDGATRGELRAALSNRNDIRVAGEAGNGREALDVLDTTHIDVALIGLTPPRRDALETCRRITAHESGTRTIMMAAAGTPALVVRAFGAGCHGFCGYRVGTDALGIAIHAAERGEHFLCPGSTQPIIDRYLERMSEDAARRISLTRRQREVLRMVAHGWRTKEIARALDLSTKTVESHRAAIMRRLGVSRVVELVHEAARLGLAPPTD